MPYTVQRYKQYWAVLRGGQLICVTVYRRGARAVADLLNELTPAEPAEATAEVPAA